MCGLMAQVNDAVLVGGKTLVSCSSDTTVKVRTPGFNFFLYFLCYLLLLRPSWCAQAWDPSSDGTCIKTLRQHSDYVTCLAAAEKNVTLRFLVIFN